MEWWHYAKNEVKHGPVTDDALKALFADGTLTGENLVWRKGMADWLPASSVEELRGAPTLTMAPELTKEMPIGGVVLAPLKTSVSLPEQPEPISAASNWKANSEERDVHELGATGPQRRPWPRLFARSIDSFLFLFLSMFTLAIVAPAVVESLGGAMVFVLLFAYSFAEAAMLSATGATPGKALFHIRVLNKDGSKLSYGAALKRSLEVWVKGMALGIDKLSLFAQGYAYNKLVTNGATPWDADRAHIVVHRELSPWKATIGGLIYAGIIALVFYVTVSQLP